MKPIAVLDGVADQLVVKACGVWIVSGDHCDLFTLPAVNFVLPPYTDDALARTVFPLPAEKADQQITKHRSERLFSVPSLFRNRPTVSGCVHIEDVQRVASERLNYRVGWRPIGTAERSLDLASQLGPSAHCRFVYAEFFFRF